MSVSAGGLGRSTAEQWFRCDPLHAGSALPLVCLPHAGGGASVFRTWRPSLPEQVGVFAGQYPGHEGRWHDPLCVDFDDLVASLADALMRSVSGDVVLFGHSFGALVAFELTRILRRTGRIRARHLIVSAARAPDTARCGPAHHDGSDGGLLDYVVKLGGVPAAILGQRMLLDMLLPIIRADLRMDESYRYTPEAPLDCPITAFAGESDRAVPVAYVDGWRRHTTHAFQLIALPTGHFWSSDAAATALAVVGRILRDVIAAR